METVRDVCRRTGITRKRLFYYDHIDLLKPTKRVGPQRTKMYGAKALERLDRILLYQKAGLRLSEIRMILDGDEAERESCLNNALIRLEAEVAVLNDQIGYARKLLDDLKHEQCEE